MRREWIICCLLALITFVVYWPVGRHDFINYDDTEFVTQNPRVQSGLNGQSLAYALTATIAGNWHPVTTLSHILDCEFLGVNAGRMHLVSVAFHSANALLLFLVLRRMTGATWRSAMVAALFALHPLRVESVAWIAERKDVLSGFFFLLTLLAYARFAEKPVISHQSSVISNQSSVISHQSSVISNQTAGPRATGRRSLITDYWLLTTDHRSLFYLLALVFFALGLMSKPMVVTLPFVLLLLDVWPLGRLQRSTLVKLVWEKWRFFALSAVGCAITLRVRKGAIELIPGLTWKDQAANAIVSYAQYLLQMLWPTRLAVLYPHPALHYGGTPGLSAWQVGAAALLLLAISAFCICQLRSRPFLAVGWFWYLGMLVPVIGLVQAGEQAMADRYTYLPMIGPVISLVWLVSELVKGEGNPFRARFALVCLGVLLLALCSVRTRHQLRYWRNSVMLFAHTLAVAPNNPSAHFFLGCGLQDQGQPNEALAQFRAAVALNPEEGNAQYNLGILLRDQENWPEAAEHCLAAARLAPDIFLPHLTLAQILPRLGRLQEAGDQMEAALRSYARLEPLTPDSSAATLFANQLNDLAWLLAASERAEDRDGPRAVRFAERACELTRYGVTVMVGTLAAAYAEAGRFPEAVATAEKACALAAAANSQPLLEKNRQLLELYRARQPYHEREK